MGTTIKIGCISLLISEYLTIQQLQDKFTDCYFPITFWLVVNAFCRHVQGNILYCSLAHQIFNGMNFCDFLLMTSLTFLMVSLVSTIVFNTNNKRVLYACHRHIICGRVPNLHKRGGCKLSVATYTAIGYVQVLIERSALTGWTVRSCDLQSLAYIRNTYIKHFAVNRAIIHNYQNHCNQLQNILQVNHSHCIIGKGHNTQWLHCVLF